MILRRESAKTAPSEQLLHTKVCRSNRSDSPLQKARSATGTFPDNKICLFSLLILIIFAIQKYITWVAVVLALVLALLLQLIALGVSSFFTIPYYYIKKWLNKQFVIQLIIYIGIVAVVFVMYSMFLKLVKNLMETDQIAFFFNDFSAIFRYYILFLKKDKYYEFHLNHFHNDY